jgi:hypothetical protein
MSRFVGEPGPILMNTQTRERKGIAVVLIHGIGDISPGNVLGTTTQEIQRHFGKVVLSEPRTLEPLFPPEPGGGQVDLKAVRARWQNRLIEIIEFHWAGVAGKIRINRPLDGLLKFLRVVKEFPLLGSVGSSSKRHRRIAVAFGAFQQWLVVALLIGAIGTFAEALVRHDAFNQAVLSVNTQFDPESGTSESGPMEIIYPFWQQGFVFTTSLYCLYFVAGLYYGFVVAGFLYFVPVRLIGGRRLTQASVLFRTITVSAVLTFLVALVLVAFTGGAVFFLINLFHPGTAPPELSESPILLAVVGVFMYWVYLKVFIVLANLFRDIVHYLAPDEHGRLQATQRKIHAELERLMERLRDDPEFGRVVFVAHSLGTVILTDVLRGKPKVGAEEDTPLLDVVTAGSPLRLVNQLLPGREPDILQLRHELAENPRVRLDRWFNAFRVFDYVGQALTYWASLVSLVPVPGRLERKRCRVDPQQGIGEYLLKPRYFFPLGHTNYWGDRRFLRFIAETVLSPVIKESESRSSTT